MKRQAPCTEVVKLMQDDLCPKCNHGYLDKRHHRFSSDRAPNIPDCSWVECDECDFKTDPE